jgi:multidrug efflux pump subunit AcrA (membrane-fusion protein)
LLNPWPTEGLSDRNESVIAAARARLYDAETGLAQALAAGADTTRARELLATARAYVDRVEAEAAAEAAQAEAVLAADIGAVAAAQTAAAEAEIRGLFAELVSVELLDVRLPPGLRHEIIGFAKAADEAADAANAAAANAAALEERAAELARARAEIVDRRAAGDPLGSDGQTLALIVADIEGLGVMIDRARAATLAPTAALNAAVARLQAAEHAWQSACFAERSRVLKAACDALERALVKAVALRYDMAQATGSIDFWRPSAELKQSFAFGKPRAGIAA